MVFYRRVILVVIAPKTPKLGMHTRAHPRIVIPPLDYLWIKRHALDVVIRAEYGFEGRNDARYMFRRAEDGNFHIRIYHAVLGHYMIRGLDIFESVR